MQRFFDEVGYQLLGAQPIAAMAPAILFWTGGVLAWTLGPGQAAAWTAADVAGWLAAYEGSSVPIFVALAVVVVSSALVVGLLTLPVLRLVEGYWPGWGWLLGARRRLTERLGRGLDRLEARAQALGTRPADNLGPREREELAALDRRLRHAPADPAHRMPTAIGNVLRAAELRPLDKYGLDAVVCWPRLWLLLPDEVQGDLAKARGDLDAATRAAVWGVLALAWSYWAPVATLLVAGVVVLFAYRSMRGAAEVYGDLLEAAFDLHRFDLYRAVGWPLPPSPAEERACGLQLTEYLFRGTAPAHATFHFAE